MQTSELWLCSTLSKYWGGQSAPPGILGKDGQPGLEKARQIPAGSGVPPHPQPACNHRQLLCRLI